VSAKASTGQRRQQPGRPRTGPGLPAAARTAIRASRDTTVIAIDDGELEGEPEREAVFSIGDDVFTMLADPPASIAAKALDLAYRRGGTDQALGMASVFIMREMLGNAAYQALLNAKRLTRPQYLAIVDRVTGRAYGAMEDEDGSPNS
jgi:hypothetical protein